MRHAIVPPVLALTTGIALGIWLLPPAAVALGLAVAAAGAATLCLRQHRPKALVCLVLTGWSAAGVALGSHAEGNARSPGLVSEVLRLGPTAQVQLFGRLREDAALTPGGVALLLDVESVEGSNISGGVRLTVLGELAPDHVARWAAGRRVRLTARVREPSRYYDPGVPDHGLMLARRGIRLVGSVKSAVLVDVVRDGSVIEELAYSIRQCVRRTVAASVGRLSAQSAAIVTAILIGDRAGLEDELERQLQEAGTFHVIAISGGNIAVFAACLLALARVIRLPWRAGVVGTAAGLLVYGSIASGGSSVSRAIVCALVYLGAVALDQRSGAPSAMAVAAACILCTSPLALLDAGFLLTFGATISILVAAQRAPALHGRPVAHAILTLVLASFATELGLLPIGAWFFYRVSVAGLLLNLAAVPLMTLVQIGGLVCVATSVLDADAGSVVAWVPHLAAEGLVRSAALVEYAPWTTWRVPPPPWWLAGAYYIVLAGWLTRDRWIGRSVPHHRASARLAAASVVAVTLLVISGPLHAAVDTHAGLLQVTTFDVGQGDSTLVETPDGAALLIDAGGLGGPSRFDIGERVVAPALWWAGVRRLDALILTHGDPDHIGGAPAVLDMFRPRRLWEGIPVPRHEPLANVVRLARAKGVEHTAARTGAVVRFGEVSVSVLSPAPPEWERQKVRNDDSVVLHIRYRDVSVVLPGDIGSDVEQSLIPTLRLAPTRILKVAHHGSATSTSAPFVAALQPAIAIVSCGRDNRYGHPAPAVVERLHAAGTAIFRTDQSGAVTVQTDGDIVKVITVLPSHHDNTKPRKHDVQMGQQN